MCVIKKYVFLNLLWILFNMEGGHAVYGISGGLNSGPVQIVQAILKGTAQLPCDISTPLANDSALLVVWYKNDMPIYSYDTRSPTSEHASHWKDRDTLEERAFFRTITEPASLSVDGVQERDEGEYTCRVDYRLSQTRNHRVTLQVVVPPQKPTIFDDNGKDVPSMAGPYEEGGNMKLTCMVHGGKPTPSVRWWRGETLIDSTDTSSAFANVRANQLLVSGLTRADQHAMFTCQASNTHLSPPVSAAVAIEIYFRPLSVDILSSNQPFSADRKYELPCQAIGSRPPVKISWSLGGIILKTYNQSDSQDGNVSTSILNFTPTRHDNGKTLICRAHHPHFEGPPYETTLVLNVFFIPILHLTLGSNLNPEDIEEGDDVYFECKVNANPYAYKVVWKHNGQTLLHNQKAGVIMSSGDLALQGVGKQQAGNYTCIASNVEGDGESNTVALRVMYKPICRTNQQRVYGIARHETATVLCEVDSFPAPENFKWSFNNSAETIDVPQTRYKTVGETHSTSTLTYTPVTEMDYGTVMCWATNLAGRQRDPCVFHIVAAGKPDSPYNCTLLNQTTESLEVECLEGFDGGQPQYFLLEVFDQQSGSLQANVSAKFPIFSVGGLDAGKALKMVLYAANTKGRSEPILLEGFTLKAAEKQTGSHVQFELTPLLGILIGVVTALLLVTVAIGGALKVRGKASGSSCSRGGATRPGALPLKEKVSLPLSQSEELYDEKNPDVVPYNKDLEYQLPSAAQTPAALNNSLRSGSDLPTYNMSTSQEENRRYNGQNSTPEVTYAELSLTRPRVLPDNQASLLTTPPSGHSPLQVGAACYRDDPTIYAQIDHSRRLPNQIASPLSPLVSPVSSLSLYPQNRPYREIVTVRTPLMGSQQESCV